MSFPSNVIPTGLEMVVNSLNVINQPSVWYHHYRLSHQSLPDNYLPGIEFVLIEFPNLYPIIF
jgi:hypothetical protein